MLWRCPRCKRVNGWTSRTKRHKKRIDTNCGICTYRVRFTPRRADEWSKSYGSEGRGRISQVTDFRIYNRWKSQGQICELAASWNLRESEEKRLNDPQSFLDEFSN